MFLFRRKSPGHSQETQSFARQSGREKDKKLILGSAEKLYPQSISHIPELRLNYSRRFQHMLVLGMTGSGKTESVLLNFADQDISHNYGITIFDGKGDYSVFNKICHLLKAKNNQSWQENLYFFAVNENKDISETYNPFLTNISPARKTDMLMKSFFEYKPQQNTDATDYYKGQARASLNMAISVLEAQKQPYNFRDLYYTLTEPQILKTLSEKQQTPMHVKIQIHKHLNDPEKTRTEKISGLLEKLSMLIEDDHINTYNPSLNIQQIIDTSKTLFISLSGTEKEKTVGKIILQDIQNTLQTRQTSRQTTQFPEHFLYLDEFSAYIYDEFLLILNKARSANVGINIMTQSYGDLARLGSAFAQSILDNTGAKIILKQDSIENSQVANLIGQSIHHKAAETWNPEGVGKRITEDYDYIFRPEQLRGLISGQAICILPLQDGIGIYKTKLRWHPQLQQAETVTYQPRITQQTQGLNLEQQIKGLYND